MAREVLRSSVQRATLEGEIIQCILWMPPMLRKYERFIGPVGSALIYLGFFIVGPSVFKMYFSKTWFFMLGLFLFACLGCLMAVVHTLASPGAGPHNEHCSAPRYTICHYVDCYVVPLFYFMLWWYFAIALYEPNSMWEHIDPLHY